MENSSTGTKNDITQEHYQGPSAGIEAIGRGAVEHWMFAFGGLFSAGALAYVFHKPAATLVKEARRVGKEWQNAEKLSETVFGKGRDTIKGRAGGFLRALFGHDEAAQSLNELREFAETHGGFAATKEAEMLQNMAMNKDQGFGNNLLSHTFGALPYIGKRFKTYLREGIDTRTQNAIAVGGIAGVAGYLGGWIKAAFMGSVHGNKGKRQFERAKTEIKDLRETNQDLEKINDQLHAKYVEAATKLDDQKTAKENETALRVSGDATETTAATSTEKSTVDAAAKPAVTLQTASHQGMLANAPALAVPEMA